MVIGDRQIPITQPIQILEHKEKETPGLARLLLKDVQEGIMGTVEWSELLRWVPCGSLENPEQELQPSSPCEATDTAGVEPSSLTLAML